jgi:hypothetical protein
MMVAWSDIDTRCDTTPMPASLSTAVHPQSASNAALKTHVFIVHVSMCNALNGRRACRLGGELAGSLTSWIVLRVACCAFLLDYEEFDRSSPIQMHY